MSWKVPSKPDQPGILPEVSVRLSRGRQRAACVPVRNSWPGWEVSLALCCVLSCVLYFPCHWNSVCDWLHLLLCVVWWIMDLVRGFSVKGSFSCSSGNGLLT